ncbi:hypothetical protein SpCBS45565_g07248 [Spizellomyces sp. 'palustris']|nr:hypothetical protein SpCBS45565_g07248 [Spizellomyces sp. 'palustris']
MFAEEGGEGQTNLRNVLRAYAVYNPEIGYCQGMGMLAGMMLMHMPPEESFWLLVSTLEKHLKNFFTPVLLQLRIDAAVFEVLLHKTSKRLAVHLDKQEVPPLMYITQWFLTLYTTTLPWDTVLRVWDMLYCEGGYDVNVLTPTESIYGPSGHYTQRMLIPGVKPLFRIGLAILRVNRDALLKHCPTNAEILSLLLHLPRDKLEADHLVDASLRVKIRRADIDNLRKRISLMEIPERGTLLSNLDFQDLKVGSDAGQQGISTAELCHPASSTLRQKQDFIALLPETSTEERKRRAEEDFSQDSAHPSKKQYTGDTASSLYIGPSNDQLSSGRPVSLNKYDGNVSRQEVSSGTALEMDMVMEDADGDIPGSGVLAYQKKAIWRQMQFYKRRYERAAGRIAVFEEKEKAFESTLVHVNTYGTKVFEDLLHFRDRMNSSLGGEEIQKYQTGDIYGSELLKQLADPEFSIEGIDNTMREQWVSIRSLLQDLLRGIDSAAAILASSHDSDSRNTSDSEPLRAERAKVDSLQARCERLTLEVSALRGDLTLRKREIRHLQNELSVASDRLSNLERKLDRSKTEPGAIVKEDIKVESEMCSPPTKCEEEADSASMVAEIRLADLQRIRTEKGQLMHELEQLRLQVANGTFSDERIRDSPIYKNLEEEYKYHVNENEIIKTRLEKLSREVEELRSERRKFTEELENEESSRRKVLETEMRKLEGDLTRIRGNRDHLQHALDLRCSKDEVEIVQMQEIRVIANTRKDRIVCLEADLQRLKMQIAADMGDQALLRFFEEETDGNPLEELRQRLRAADNKIKSLEDTVNSYQDASESVMDRQQLLLSERQARRGLESARRQIESYERCFGTLPDSDAAGHLVAKLHEKNALLEKLQGKIEYYEKTESRLLSEIETLGKAWAELEDQNSRKVLNLAQKEDHILRLMAEKTKYDQKCAMLTKQSTTYNNLGIALKRQADKQLEQIRILEQREKALSQQLQAREKELAAKSIAGDQQQRRCGELIREVAGLKDKEQRWSAKYDNATSALKRKITLLENTAEEHRKAREEVEILQRRLDKSTKSETTPDTNLMRQIEEYKVTALAQVQQLQ